MIYDLNGHKSQSSGQDLQKMTQDEHSMDLKCSVDENKSESI